MAGNQNYEPMRKQGARDKKATGNKKYTRRNKKRFAA